MLQGILKAEVKISTGCICTGYLMALAAAVYLVERYFGTAYGLLAGELLFAALILARGIYEAVSQQKPTLLYAGLMLVMTGIWVLGTIITADALASGAFCALGSGIAWMIFGIVMWRMGR